MSSADEKDDGHDFGRGMLSLSIDEAGIIQMKHLLNGKTFEFDRGDLDEVIGMLGIFRLQIETSEFDDEPGEGNGEL